MSTSHLAPGTKVGNPKYAITEFLGGGSQADVYIAEQESVDRKVALKLLLPNPSNDRSFVERFRKEAIHTAGLEHAHIVPVYDTGMHEGRPWIAMRLIKGGSLADLLEERTCLELDEVLEIGLQMAKALDHAHRNGLVHRDVKPANVLMDTSENVYLADFGIAKAMDDDAQMTLQGEIFGTAPYMSPEQCEGQDLDGRSDLYSLAVMLFEMATGARPFQGKNSQAIMLKHIGAPPEWPESASERLGSSIMQAIEQGLAKKRSDRPNTCQDLIRLINEASQGIEADPYAVPATHVEEEDILVPTATSHRNFYGSALLVGALVGSGLFMQSNMNPLAGGLAQAPTDHMTIILPEDQIVPGDTQDSEPANPAMPPPTWPTADWPAPTWVGPQRIAIHVDGSAKQWTKNGAPDLLSDLVARPLRKGLEDLKWNRVRQRADWPDDAYSDSTEWAEAIMGLNSDLVVLIGMQDADWERVSGVGYDSDTYTCSVQLRASLVEVSSGTCLVTSTANAVSDRSFDAFPEAMANAVQSKADSLVDKMTEQVEEWRAEVLARGNVLHVAVVSQGLDGEMHNWFSQALRNAPGGIPGEFSGEDTPSEQGELPVPEDLDGEKNTPKKKSKGKKKSKTGNSNNKQDGSDGPQEEEDPLIPLPRDIELQPGFTMKLAAGESLSRWTLSYRGEISDLQDYLQEGQRRYRTWSGASVQPKVQVRGSWLILRL